MVPASFNPIANRAINDLSFWRELNICAKKETVRSHLSSGAIMKRLWISTVHWGLRWSIDSLPIIGNLNEISHRRSWLNRSKTFPQLNCVGGKRYYFTPHAQSNIAR